MYQRLGILSTQETGITISGATDATYIGHCTFIQSQIRQNLFRCLLKYLFAKMGVAIRNLQDLIPCTLNDTLYIGYKINLEDGTGRSSHSYAMNPAASSVDSLVTAILSDFGQGSTELFLMDISYAYTSGAVATNINLLYATISLDIKSNLKLQNVTAATVGQEADAVNNVPLYGKSYYGNGTGTMSNRNNQTEVTMFANEVTGIIQKTGAVAAGTSEMPPASYFKQVSGSGKAKIEPGEIKTSTLVQKQSYSLKRLMKFLYNGTATLKDDIHTGKFAFFGFEHMIKATTSDPTISIKAEHNWAIGIMMKTKFVNVTDIKVNSAQYVTF